MIAVLLPLIAIVTLQSRVVSQRYADALLVESLRVALTDFDARHRDAAKLPRRAVAMSDGRSIVASALGRKVDTNESVPAMSGVVVDADAVKVECGVRRQGYPWDCQLRGADVYAKLQSIGRVKGAGVMHVSVEVVSRSLASSDSMRSYVYVRDFELRNGSWYPVGEPRYLVP